MQASSKRGRHESPKGGSLIISIATPTANSLAGTVCGLPATGSRAEATLPGAYDFGLPLISAKRAATAFEQRSMPTDGGPYVTYQTWPRWPAPQRL